MSPIQSILILLMIVMTGLYFYRLRSRFLDNAIVLVMAGGAVILVLVPDWTTLLAHVLGVGRGADLIMYLGGIGMAFFCLLLYSKLRVLQAQFTELVRYQAIREPGYTGKESEHLR